MSVGVVIVAGLTIQLSWVSFIMLSVLSKRSSVL